MRRMADNPAVADLRKDRAMLADQLESLESGHIQMGTPQAHETRLIWLRAQIVALDVAIVKIEAADDA